MTTAFIFVALMLVVGVICRQQIPSLRRFFIPASVIAGGIGLLLLQLVQRTLGRLEDPFSQAVAGGAEMLSGELGSWPGWLIAVVFAGLLLERREPSAGSRARHTLSQIIMVWVIVLGQTAVGMTLTWLVIGHLTDVPNSFGMLIETGFAGGHGTAGAMGEVFAHPSINLIGGIDLGTMVATFGLVYGVVSGIAWINLAARLGWVRREELKSPDGLPDSQERDAGRDASSSVKRQSKPLGFEILDRDVIDPLLLQVLWLALAFGIGAALHASVAQVSEWLDQRRVASVNLTESGVAGAESSDSGEALVPGENAAVDAGNSGRAADAQWQKRLSWSAILGGFPLFIYTLLGGWLVRRALMGLGVERLIDTQLLKHLGAVAMDVLVVAAMASLNLNAVVSQLVPLSILLLGGCIWTGVCLMLLARRILPASHWFQLGLINYGMSTGTTATGFVLLRVVDPQLDTDAAEDYALAAPFSAPFIGGGLLTVGLPLLVLENVSLAVSASVLCVLVAGLIGVGFWLRSADAGDSGRAAE